MAVGRLEGHDTSAQTGIHTYTHLTLWFNVNKTLSQHIVLPMFYIKLICVFLGGEEVGSSKLIHCYGHHVTSVSEYHRST